MAGLLSGRRVTYCLFALVAVLGALLYTSRSDKLQSLGIFQFSHHSRPSWDPKSTKLPFGWQNQALSPAQCQDEFPELYYEVDRAVSLWKNKQHIISPEDVNISWRNDAAFRILIHDNELRILETKNTWGNEGYRARALSVLSLLQLAIWSASASGELLPTIEAAVVVDDMSLLPGGEGDTRSVWTFCSNVHDESHKRHWLIPDFNFYSAPATHSFEDMRRRAEQHDAPFVDKIPKALWRGVVWTNEPLRSALVKETEGKFWADAAVIDWKTKENVMNMDEMCAYAANIHTEGRSYSGRLPFLLNCDSLPIIHDLDWTTHFYHLLVSSGPHQNYVPVKRDFSDLGSKVQWYLDRPQEARKIVSNSINRFRSKYTMPAATSCYLRRLIVGWSQVSFTPAVDRDSSGDKVGRRGISFAEMIHMEKDYHEDA